MPYRRGSRGCARLIFIDAALGLAARKAALNAASRPRFPQRFDHRDAVTHGENSTHCFRIENDHHPTRHCAPILADGAAIRRAISSA